ncbi:Hsp70 family protein [Microbacterium saperdae]
MARAVGIDLGTTYSAVAVLDDAGIPMILRNAQGGSTTESVVLFEQSDGKDAPVVGGVAKRQAGVRPDDIVQHVKRYMGDPSWRFDSATDAQYRPEEISAIILRALVRDAEAALGETIHDVVITVPAYFDDSRRTATQQAGAIAGLNVLRVFNEPTAAALAYGLGTGEDGIVLVYDLGGGTFDVSILGIEGRTFTTLATDGDRNLGGFDWDNALMKLVVGELETVHGVTDFYDDVDAVAELREKAEHAKRALSTVDSTSIQLSFQGTHYSVTVTREQFEAASASLLRRTQELVEDTLDTSGLEWDDIASVLLVGGSTRMPAVRALMDRISGIAPVDGVDPDEAVALGAAIQAALSGGESTAPGLAGVEIADVTSHALGTTALDENDVIKNWVLIERNTKIPAQGMNVLTTNAPRTEIHVWVTQGDDPDVDFVTEIGHGVIQLAEEWPAGVDFAVVYRYDIDQTVTVEVYRMPDEEYVGAFEIDRVANLTEAKVAEAAEKLDRLEVPVLTAPPVATKSAPMTRLAPLGTTGQEHGQVRPQQTVPATEGNRA